MFLVTIPFSKLKTLLFSTPITILKKVCKFILTQYQFNTIIVHFLYRYWNLRCYLFNSAQFYICLLLCQPKMQNQDSAIAFKNTDRCLVMNILLRLVGDDCSTATASSGRPDNTTCTDKASLPVRLSPSRVYFYTFPFNLFGLLRPRVYTRSFK